MKTVADKEDSFIPILFLFICSVILGQELSMLFENLQKVGSVILIWSSKNGHSVKLL